MTPKDLGNGASGATGQDKTEKEGDSIQRFRSLCPNMTQTQVLIVMQREQVYISFSLSEYLNFLLTRNKINLIHSPVQVVDSKRASAPKQPDVT